MDRGGQRDAFGEGFSLLDLHLGDCILLSFHGALLDFPSREAVHGSVRGLCWVVHLRGFL